MKQQITEQATGITGATITAAAAAGTWIEQLNHYIDAAAGIVAIVVGLVTIIWQVQKIIKARGEPNDQDNSTE